MRHVISGMILLLACQAHAAPPPDADPNLAPWFNSLRLPQSAVPCCSMADCRPVLSRVLNDHYEALIEGKWRAVPDDRVLTRPDNPTGHAVVCWTPFAGVLCFIKAPESWARKNQIIGAKVKLRLLHNFHIRDGLIAREIGYEVWLRDE